VNPVILVLLLIAWHAFSVVFSYSTFILFITDYKHTNEECKVEFHACFAKHNLAAMFVSIIYKYWQRLCLSPANI